jgi:phage terminase large subunit
VQGTIIAKLWLDACVDAHIKLGIPVEGGKMSALDIGDSEDGDRNAQSIRQGIVLTWADEWVARDPGVTARKAMGNCVKEGVPELQYDAAGGLGSIVKSEVNRLADEGVKLKVFCVPWNAGGKVLKPGDRVDPDDKESPLNKNYFANLKAQAWHSLAGRVYRTWRAVSSGGKLNPESGMVECPEWQLEGEIIPPATYDPDDLISIDSRLPLLHKVTKELCQPTASQGSRLKLVVDKAPDGTRSPNIGDSIVMNYHPMPRTGVQFVNVGLGAKVFVGGVPL